MSSFANPFFYFAQTQHRTLNNFLNTLVAETLPSPSQSSARVPIEHTHLRETDTFYDLTPEGIRSLPPSLTQWLQHGRRTSAHRPRVRITLDRDTGAPKARIIKSRISDLDVYCPGNAFDYRISISIEAPFD